MMDRKRNVLLVEDDSLPYRALKEEFEAAGWNVVRAVDADSALYEYEQMRHTEKIIDIAAVDLGLPPERNNPLRVGVPLVQTLRERDETLPILAYTGIPPNSLDPELIVARLLPLRVSFVYMRHLSKHIDLALLLDLVWQGFVLLSPPAADSLPQAVASKPDPLSGPLWETLKFLNNGLGDKEIAQALPDVREGGVKSRLSKIREILSQTGEVQTTDRDDLIRWYRRHYVRYSRY